MDKIQRNFEKFHRQNPHVYVLFNKFAYRMIYAGLKNGSARLIIERIRWETAVETISDQPVKINNNYTPRYARLWMNDNPSFPDYFRTRALATNSIDSVKHTTWPNRYDAADPNSYF